MRRLDLAGILIGILLCLYGGSYLVVRFRSVALSLPTNEARVHFLGISHQEQPDFNIVLDREYYQLLMKKRERVSAFYLPLWKIDHQITGDFF